jgi:hypothetical protein
MLLQQDGAPGREKVRILGTDAGDKGTVESLVLLVAQGARGTIHAQAAPGECCCYSVRRQWRAGGIPAETAKVRH